MSWHRDKLAATAVAGLAGAIICTPPYVISRVGEGLLGSHPLFALGVALIVIGLALEAGATGAVKAIKVSARLLASQAQAAPGGTGRPGTRPARISRSVAQPVKSSGRPVDGDMPEDAAARSQAMPRPCAPQEEVMHGPDGRARPGQAAEQSGPPARTEPVHHGGWVGNRVERLKQRLKLGRRDLHQMRVRAA
jgi:hypothetical protein